MTQFKDVVYCDQNDYTPVGVTWLDVNRRLTEPDLRDNLQDAVNYV